MKILVSITSTGKKLDFAKKIKQIDDLGINEIALFPTTLDFKERQGLYEFLEKSKIKKIPFVHLKSDMEIEEVDYLTSRFGAEIFNVHGSNSGTPLENDLKKYADQIYVENQFSRLGDDDLVRFAGLCLDVSHLYDLVATKSELAPYFLDLFKKYPCQCGHISSITEKTRFCPIDKVFFYSNHLYSDLSQFDYLKQYRDILPPLLALELENNIPEQVRAKEYIERILNIDGR
ncbi:MAG: hypothetical protein AAB791_02530 [Patescibacteria group bacterium]